ncbi:polyribonucleotide nucleotidyltransferase, partial [Candidatus Falkowbacteria bacterium]|nr:polyribonucleotide nucleotidyltransferase [Candidatus Falkowbacteria bacterium]
FNRGETQVLSSVTLGAPGDEQVLDGMEVVGKKKYMHHYNFPPFSVGEASPMRGAGRREIGHGALAEKAIVPVLPDPMEFPYTIRVVSEVLGSNGSSSMASTCASTLALMDAGVPIKKPVAGIAMGLASDAKGKYKIITDLQDLEDGIGGMDFKIAGTRDGITAAQMDTKTNGLSLDIIKDTLKQSNAARLQILDKIEQTISAPRPELSPYAPRIITLHINPDKIRDVIGPGGKIINEIIDKTGVQIDIEQDGSVFITSANADNAAKAKDWVISLTKEVAVGEIYTGKVSRLFDFGVMVEILPKTEGLIHISEISNQRVRDVRDVFKIGQEVTAKVISIDEKGRVNLSVKQLKK